MSGENSLIVRKIENGTVIDHIPDGKALIVLDLLGIDGREEKPVSFVMHVSSSKLGKKDIVKVEDMFLEKRILDNLALVAPSATINIIKNYKIVKKSRIEVPTKLSGILKCPNPNCITNEGREPVTPTFTMEQRDPLLYKCDYCDRLVKEEDIPQLLI
jgi:aspartate carbamoyltransferase regulatory subunit